MKRVMMLAVVPALLLLGGQAAANPIACGGYIAPYGDAAGTECGLYDTAPVWLDVYFVHMPAQGGAKAVRFSAPQPDCFIATHLFDIYGTFPDTAGTFRDGIVITYSGCETAPVLLGHSTYLTQGLTPECCFYITLGHPDATVEDPEELSCDDEWVGRLFGYAQINPSANWCTSPVEETTWGRVKALYGR